MKHQHLMVRELQSRLRGIADGLDEKLGLVYLHPYSALEFMRSVSAGLRQQADAFDRWIVSAEDSMNGAE